MKIEESVNNATTGLDIRRGLHERLHLISAAETHVVWKNRLGEHVQGLGQEPLCAALLGQKCQLGELIGGAAFAAFRGMDAHRQLCVAHDTFHRLADAVIERLNGGDHKAARVLFENELTDALHDMLRSLTCIQRQLMDRAD